MAFRLVAVVTVAWLIHKNTLRNAENGLRPIRLSEVQAYLPEAHKLQINGGPNGGFRVVDRQRRLIGFASRTMPHSKSIKGYSGPTDVLIVYNAKQELQGIAIRHSYDTPSHVEDVVSDYLFMEQWNGMPRQQIADMVGLAASKFHIVSGASRTSEAVVGSVTLRAALGSEKATGRQPVTFRWQDAALLVCVISAILLSFSKSAAIQKRKVWIHIAMVLYIGLISGDLLAQSLLVNWVAHGVPWSQLIGLVTLAAVAFFIPWSTGKPTYCTHICPHGHAQRWLMKIIPAKKKRHLGKDEKWSFSALPGLLLITILVATFWNLPIDLAGFEPFDAWSIKGVGIATVTVAIIGLLFSLFVPMGYCRYGCPTGFLFDLVKKEKKGFRAKDWWLLAMLALSIALYFN